MLASSTASSESESYVGEGGDPTLVQGTGQQRNGTARLTVGHTMTGLRLIPYQEWGLRKRFHHRPMEGGDTQTHEPHDTHDTQNRLVRKPLVVLIMVVETDQYLSKHGLRSPIDS